MRRNSTSWPSIFDTNRKESEKYAHQRTLSDSKVSSGIVRAEGGLGDYKDR